MKQNNWKFFVVIGILLVIAGFIVFPNDDIVGIIGVFLGVYNVFKGFRLYRGVQPLVFRKEQERREQEKKDLDEEFKQNNHKNDSKK